MTRRRELADALHETTRYHGKVITPGQRLDAAIREIERASRRRNREAAEAEMHALGRLVDSGELDADQITRRLTAAMEAAGVPKWRAWGCVSWLLDHMRDPDSTSRPPASTRPPPDILIGPGDLTSVVDQAEEAVLGGGYQLYQRAGVVVRVVPSRGPELQVVDVSPEHLHEMLDKAGRFLRVDPKDDKQKRCACPQILAKTYLGRRGAGWNLPTLTGVLSAPTMREDGSILDLPGYDLRTGLLLDTAGVTYPEIPDRPTVDDAYEAIELLDGLLAEFPFVDDTDRSVALAAMLTAACRRGLPAAPMFAFTAPAPGTGKSYLVDIVSHIGTGRPAAGLSYGADQNENRKAIDAALLAGAATLVFDNVSCEIAGDRLNQVLTQPSITLRVLGQSRNVTADCGALVMANGNALTIAADMIRRTMLCRLDAGIERPELRKFAGDPVAELASKRGIYLAAALTVLRAYHVLGRPDCPAPLASFQAWSDLVRGALLWLDYADPVASMEHVRANDPKRSDHLAVLESWSAAVGIERVTVKRLIDVALNNGDLREALLVVAGERGNINSRRLGSWLRSNRDKLVDGMKLCSDGTLGGATVWRLHGGNIVRLPTTESNDDSADSFAA